jgi:hypothetical protein
MSWPASPRFLYLHGFASGPGSHKGRALAAYYAERGVELARLDMRQPSLERLRLSAMMDHLAQAIGGPADRAVVFGSSLGGLTAARVAERDARIAALVLLAPAFRLVERWRGRMTPAAWDDWRDSGFLAITDYTTGQPARVDFGFAEDALAHDAGWPDVRVPTLILHGRSDQTVDIELSRTFAEGKRHVRLVELDDDHELGRSVARIAEESARFLAPFLGG